jgi:hypothetical protein
LLSSLLLIRVLQPGDRHALRGPWRYKDSVNLPLRGHSIIPPIIIIMSPIARRGKYFVGDVDVELERLNVFPALLRPRAKGPSRRMSARFVTRGRLCLASGGPDMLVGPPSEPSECVHRAATRRDCGLGWSPSAKPARPAALAALWESALNSSDGDLSFSPDTMKQVRQTTHAPAPASCRRRVLLLIPMPPPPPPPPRRSSARRSRSGKRAPATSVWTCLGTTGWAATAARWWPTPSASRAGSTGNQRTPRTPSPKPSPVSPSRADSRVARQFVVAE